jgi:hypothetical protein
MIKVAKIVEIAPYYIVCDFNNGVKKRLEILPLIESQKKFRGIELLKEKEIFESARIGIMGEVLWKDIITIKNELWNYDISPEFIFYNGTTVIE